MPPTIPEPNPKLDVTACRMVREAVGPDVELMLDPYHDYSREQALYIAKELEKLNFLWLEEPMDENSIASYQWLSQKTNLSLCGPETAEGKSQNRCMPVPSTDLKTFYQKGLAEFFTGKKELTKDNWNAFIAGFDKIGGAEWEKAGREYAEKNNLLN